MNNVTLILNFSRSPLPPPPPYEPGGQWTRNANPLNFCPVSCPLYHDVLTQITFFFNLWGQIHFNRKYSVL